MGIKYEAAAEKVLTGLKGFEDSFSKERYIEFENKLHDMKNTVQEFMKDNRQLKIGVVGEVKAGKSSFINALVSVSYTHLDVYKRKDLLRLPR